MRTRGLRIAAVPLAIAAVAGIVALSFWQILSGGIDKAWTCDLPGAACQEIERLARGVGGIPNVRLACHERAAESGRLDARGPGQPIPLTFLRVESYNPAGIVTLRHRTAGPANREGEAIQVDLLCGYRFDRRAVVFTRMRAVP